MERSLRSTGCDLPIWVVPYSDDLFELPPNSKWWVIPEIINWIDQNSLWPAFKKIQCFTEKNYQFVDTDIIFFKNPQIILQNFEGFITSCGHWRDSSETVTPETIKFFESKSSNWQKYIFNSGQWACSEVLYDSIELIDFCTNNYQDTLFRKNRIYKDQAGINLLVNQKNIKITNLTLPTIDMESTWAGDYQREFQFNNFEKRDKPYLIHWAGTPILHTNFINSYFFKFLTENEKKAFVFKKTKKQSKFRRIVSHLRAMVSVIKEE